MKKNAEKAVTFLSLRLQQGKLIIPRQLSKVKGGMKPERIQ
ncbi:MAG: hypothetical protein AAGG75_24950 [Bacteroidota bacterium]